MQLNFRNFRNFAISVSQCFAKFRKSCFAVLRLFLKIRKVSQIRVFASFHKYKFRKVSQIGFSFRKVSQVLQGFRNQQFADVQHAVWASICALASGLHICISPRNMFFTFCSHTLYIPPTLNAKP